MRLAASITGDLSKLMRAEVTAVSGALKAGVKETSGDLKQMLRDQVSGSGMGSRLAKTWRDAVYPAGASPTMSPAGLVWSKAPKIIRAFDEGALIRAQSGLWLTIPTEAAPRRGLDGKRISPATFPEARYGPLRFVPRRRGPSLLVVDAVRVGARGRVSRRLANAGRTKSGRLRSGTATVVMFLLVRQVRLPKRLNVSAARRRAEGRLAGNIERHLRASDDRQQT